MSKMQKIAAVFLVVAVAAWILEKMEIFAVPGLTATALCVATRVEGADLLKGTGRKKNSARRLAAVLVLAFGLFNLVVGGMEIYQYVLELKGVIR